MAQDDDSLDRLESALDRIGRRVEQPDPVAAEVASRLDAVIVRLRAGLAGTDASGSDVSGRGAQENATMDHDGGEG